MYLEKMLTQEELPQEPGSGSKGSSTVEPTLTTSLRSATALLVITLTDVLENVLRSAAKAGRWPHHHDHTRPQRRSVMSLPSPPTSRWQAPSHQSVDAGSKDSIPLAPSKRRSAVVATGSPR